MKLLDLQNLDMISCDKESDLYDCTLNALLLSIPTTEEFDYWSFNEFKRSDRVKLMTVSYERFDSRRFHHIARVWLDGSFLGYVCASGREGRDHTSVMWLSRKSIQDLIDAIRSYDTKDEYESEVFLTEVEDSSLYDLTGGLFDTTLERISGKQQLLNLADVIK